MALPVVDSLSIEGLIFQGFWVQRPYYIRLLCYFDAKGLGLHRPLDLNLPQTSVVWGAGLGM